MCTANMTDTMKARMFGAGVPWPLAAIFNWIAFGSGARHFRSAVSIADRNGRLVFEFVAAALDALVAAVALR